MTKKKDKEVPEQPKERKPPPDPAAHVTPEWRKKAGDK